MNSASRVMRFKIRKVLGMPNLSADVLSGKVEWCLQEENRAYTRYVGLVAKKLQRVSTHRLGGVLAPKAS